MKKLLIAGAVLSVLATSSMAAYAAAPADDLGQIRQQLEGLLERVNRLEQQNTTLAAENAELKAASAQDQATQEYLLSQTRELRETSATADVAIGNLRGAEWAQRITVRGDLRYRHEEIQDDARAAGGTLATADRYRDRIRLRAGIDARPLDNFLITAQFATTENGDPRSSNQSLDGTYSRKSLDLDQAYFDWKFASWGNLLGGKMRIPYVRPGQSLFFDGDLNPEGLALQFTSGIWFGSLYGTYLDEVSGAETAVTADAMVNGGQIGARLPVGSSTLMLAAHYYDLRAGQGRRGIFYNCTATSDGCSNGNTTIGAAGSGVLAYDFNVIELSAQWNTLLGRLPFQLWADAAENRDPEDLNRAYAVGFLFGGAANYRTWEAGALYQKVEKDALFAQLIDSDFGGGTSDSSGFLLRAGYAPLRNWIFNATYFINERNVDVGTQADYDRLQLDMNLRF